MHESAQDFRPLHRRIARRLARELRKPFKPLLEKLRDKQAPRLHHWMMHEASVPMQLPRGSALVIAPHHDDETFGCGGLIALKHQANIPVDVLVMTDGRQSHGHIAGVDLDQMTQTRKQELLNACAILGVAAEKVHFLDLPDQGVYRLTPEQHQQAVRRVGDLIFSLRPREIYVNHRTDRHPDHEAVFRIASDAIAQASVPIDVYQYPIWLIWKGPYRWNDHHPQDLKGARRLDVRSVQQLKDKAIAAYASQHQILPGGFLGQFTQGYELFF
jgi:LmbE family N-acetylglucosaminyl deacetylase